MVNSSPYSAHGPIFGRSRATLRLLPEDAGQEPGDQGDPEEDQHAEDDRADRELGRRGRQPQPRRQRLEVEPAQGSEGDHLEDGVDRDQYGGSFAVTAGEVVPDEHHRDAAREAHDDQAGPVLRQVGKEDPREAEHEGRSDDPVQHQRGHQQASVRADAPGLVVADLRQDRVHHHQQPDRDGQGHRPDLHRLQRGVQAGDEPPQQESHGHGGQDPYREPAIEEGHLLHHARLLHILGGRAHQAQTPSIDGYR